MQFKLTRYLATASRKGLNPQSAKIFQHRLRDTPDVIAGQIDVFPPERGQVTQQAIRNVPNLTQGGGGVHQISRVPENHRGDEQVEAGHEVLLVVIDTITNFSEPRDEDRECQ